MYKRKFLIRGVNVKTKRSNKKEIKALCEEQCRKIAIEEGLEEPIEILEIITFPPSDHQLRYAKELGITIPLNITNNELSDIISYKVNRDIKPTVSLMQYADTLEVEYSEYVGERDLATRVLAKLPIEKQIAFYLYSVYKAACNTSIYALHEEPRKNDFIDFADEMVADIKFLNSFRREILTELNASFPVLYTEGYIQKFFMSRAYALEKCEHYLKYKFDIKATKKAVPQTVSKVDSSSVVANKKGCTSVLVLFIVSLVIAMIFRSLA